MLIYAKVFIPIVLFLILLAWLLTKPSGRHGLRPVGGMRIKNILAHLLIKFGPTAAENEVGLDAVNGRIPPADGKPIEDYNDSFVFLGMDAENTLVMTRLGFREDGRLVEVWVWMIVDGKRYSIPVNTIQDGPRGGESLEAGGLSYFCSDKKAGTWRIGYDGPMSPDIEKCSIELSYLPRSQMYHSGHHMDPSSFGRAMGEMPWSREYFENLRSENQCRIEQGGSLTGTIVLDGRSKQVDLFAIRDHSWGKRNWSFIFRHIWTVVALERPLVLRGRQFTYLIFTAVDYGTSFKNLVSGWMAGPHKLLPISEATDMSTIGGDGVIPERFVVRFRAKGMPIVEMRIRRTQPDYSWFMHDNTFEVSEAWCEATIGTVKGYGLSEFGYSHLRDYGRSLPHDARSRVDSGA